MTKIYIKLIAMAMALILSVSVVIMSSYAWMVLSGNPAATGIQVAVGGGNTILIAPNVKVTDEETGEVYNYPGYFSDNLNFGQSKEYAYLSELSGLTPVSTSNGIDWFLSEKKVDSELSYANLLKSSEEDMEKAKEGSYIYLDFWVVSPSGEHTLRVSTGDEKEDGGSFVIDLRNPVFDEETQSYVFEEPEGSAAACARIGFLANDVMLTDKTMEKYVETGAFDKKYTSLRGLYQEPESGTPYLDADRFTIYEPNANSHPGNEEYDGSYVLTTPWALVGGKAEKTEVFDILTAQLSSEWANAEKGEGTAIEQKLKAATFGKTFSEETNLFYEFYVKTLQGQVSPDIKKGQFISSSSNLGEAVNEESKAVSPESLDELNKGGATEDVNIIKLERNVPQRIRMFVWIEAQDIDCATSAGSARFAVNIEFAGATE